MCIHKGDKSTSISRNLGDSLGNPSLSALGTGPGKKIKHRLPQRALYRFLLGLHELAADELARLPVEASGHGFFWLVFVL